jgi:hypothetical protein
MGYAVGTGGDKHAATLLAVSAVCLLVRTHCDAAPRQEGAAATNIAFFFF